MRFHDQVALVTGGSSGIGLAMARQLAAQGAHVWVVARNPDKLASALAEVEGARLNPGQRCGTACADVARADEAMAAVAHVTECVGAPNLVINSAGVAHPGYFQDLELDIFRWMMEVNYFGTVNMTKAVVPKMLECGAGHIVNVSSLAGILGVFGYTAYGASKFAVRGFSDALRAELKPHGIRVSIVFPPDTDTPQLAYENRFKPFETKELAGGTHALSPEVVAAHTLRGVARGQYMIIPGLEGKLFYWLSGLVGTGLYPVMDMLIAQAQRKKNKSR